MQNFNQQFNRPPQQPNPQWEALKAFARKNTRTLVILGLALLAALVLFNQAFFIVGEA